MPKKYYAVAVGREPGIYDDWNTCKQQVDGYSGAIYKGFVSKMEAENYISQFKASDDTTYDYQAYTDGSFKNNKMGYAYVLIDNNESIINQENGSVLAVNNISTNNIAEITAINKALQFINERANGLKQLKNKTELQILINTDSNYAYQQIAMLKAKCLELGWNNWEAQFASVLNFDLLKVAVWHTFMLQSNSITVDYKHVDAHCGVTFNEMADKLADQGRDSV